jgi:hypothetical protein
VSKIPHFLENRLSEDGAVVSLTRRPRFAPQGDSWYELMLKASILKDHSAAGRIRSLERYSDLIGGRVRDITACSGARQQTTLPHASCSSKVTSEI